MNAPISGAEQTALSVTLNMTDDVRRQLQQGETALVQARKYEIVCPGDAQLVAEEMNGYKRTIVRLEDLRKGFLKPAQEIIENAKSLFNPAIDSLKGAEQHCKRLLGDWDAKERTRIEAERQAAEATARKARQEAEAKAAAERARAEELAREERRKAAEAEERRRKAEAEGNARAAAAAAAEAAKATEKAAAAVENGEARATQLHLEAAAVASAAPVLERAKVAGASMRDNWVARRKDGVSAENAKSQIVAACAARPDLLGLLELNEGAINKLAKALKTSLNVPGYEARNEPIVSGSRK